MEQNLTGIIISIHSFTRSVDCSIIDHVSDIDITQYYSMHILNENNKKSNL